MTEQLRDNTLRRHHCPLCRGTVVSEVWNADRIKEGTSVRWCSGCGFGWQSPLPRQTEIYREFSHSIYMIQSEKEKTRGFEGRLRRLNALLPNQGNLIDIGCGSGHFLAQAQQSGWIVKGLEPHKKAAEHCRNRYNLDVAVGTMDEYKFKPESFDAVTLWDVWEHVYDPVAFMDRCLELVAPGGILALAIPNASGWPARLFKGNWRYVMFGHLSYFKLSFVNRFMDQRHMHCVHSDHTIKIQSLLQGVLPLLPFNYNTEKMLRIGRRDGIETESTRIQRANPDAKTGRVMHLARQLALAINLIRFAFPVGDMVDMYFRKR